MDVFLYSSNPGKIKELTEMLSDLPLVIKHPDELSVETGIDETGTTFVENAIIKARDGCIKTGLPCIADDSGLIVDALPDALGVHTARYATEHVDYDANMELLLSELSSIESAQRTARFVCCLVYMRSANDPDPLIATGSLSGQIAHKRSGTKGFGYDPVFYLPTYQQTFADMSSEIKNTISHRAVAMGYFKNLIKDTL